MNQPPFTGAPNADPHVRYDWRIWDVQGWISSSSDGNDYYRNQTSQTSQHQCHYHLRCVRKKTPPGTVSLRAPERRPPEVVACFFRGGIHP